MRRGDALAAATALFDLDESSIRCPYPIFDALREADPVAWVESLDAYVVTRYDLVVEVLRQPELFSSRYTTGRTTDRQIAALLRELRTEDAEIGAMLARRAEHGTTPVLVRADPPIHGRQRALVNRAFSPAAIRALEPDIEALARSLVDGFADRGSVELVSEFAVPLPMTVIAQALGVALDRRDDFKRWSDGIVGGIGRTGMGKAELTEVVRARSELEAYLVEVIDEREQRPTDDLVSRIVHARVDGERLTHHEIMDMVVQFLLAGNETTAKLISATALRLALDADLAARLRRDPELVAPFLEEVLRLEPPSSGNYRIATADYELSGTHIPAGSALWLVYAAGNRDPATFDAPEECRVDRAAESPHLSFGLGPHFCLGAGLARAESRIAVQALLSRCDDLGLAIEPSDILYEASYLVHGIRALPLTFRARS
jgi:cytochrome P450